MSWGAVGSIAIAAVGSYAQSRSDRRSQRDQAGLDRLSLMTGGDEDRRTVAFEAALQNHYQQQSNDRARKSLANFARFSTAPQGGEPYYEPEQTQMPNFADFANPENKPQPQPKPRKP